MKGKLGISTLGALPNTFKVPVNGCKKLYWAGTESGEGASFYWIGCFIKEGCLRQA